MQPVNSIQSTAGQQLGTHDLLAVSGIIFRFALDCKADRVRVSFDISARGQCLSVQIKMAVVIFKSGLKWWIDLQTQCVHG